MGLVRRGGAPAGAQPRRGARLALAGEGFVWLGLKDPSDADLEALADQFDLHPLAVEDAAHGHTRSKLEVFGDTLFVVISTVAYVDHEEMTATSETTTSRWSGSSRPTWTRPRRRCSLAAASTRWTASTS